MAIGAFSVDFAKNVVSCQTPFHVLNIKREKSVVRQRKCSGAVDDELVCSEERVVGVGVAVFGGLEGCYVKFESRPRQSVDEEGVGRVSETQGVAGERSGVARPVARTITRAVVCLADGPDYGVVDGEEDVEHLVILAFTATEAVARSEDSGGGDESEGRHEKEIFFHIDTSFYPTAKLLLFLQTGK